MVCFLSAGSDRSHFFFNGEEQTVSLGSVETLFWRWIGGVHTYGPFANLQSIRMASFLRSVSGARFASLGELCNVQSFVFRISVGVFHTTSQQAI